MSLKMFVVYAVSRNIFFSSFRTIDWFDKKVADPLYSLFSGNGSKIADRKTSACSPRVKLKILQHLQKCRESALNVLKGIQVIFEGLFGEPTTQKCKVASLQFAGNLIVHGQYDMIEKLSKVLQTYITKLIGTESVEPVDVQNAGYQAISKLIITCPDTFNKDVRLIVDYFNYLTAASPDMHNSIRECLVALAQAFKWDPSKQKDEPMEMDDEGNVEKKKFVEKFSPTSNHLLLLGQLQDQSDSKLPIAQNITSLFLTTCFPSYYAPTRYLLLVLCGNCPPLRENIYAYLYGSQRKDHINYTKLISCDLIDDDANEQELLTSQTIILPSFKSIMHYISQIAEKKLSGASERFGGQKVPFNLDVFTEILDYLHHCLWFTAGCKNEPGNAAEMHILSEFISKLDETGNIVHIEKFTKLIRNIIIVKKGYVELTCLLDILSAAPLIITKNNLDLRLILASSLKEVNESIRTMIAKIYAILLSYGTDMDTFKSEITNLSSASQKSLEHQHGSILALSNAIFYRVLFYRQNKDSEGLSQLLKSSEIKNATSYLVKLLTDQKSLLVLAAIQSLSTIGCCMELPLDEIIEESDQNNMEVDEHHQSKNYVFKTIIQLLKSTQTKQKIREDSAICLGHLSIGDQKFFAKR